MSEHMSCISLGALAEITMGQSPSSSSHNLDERGLPFLQGCAEFEVRYPKPQQHCYPPLRIARKGSILISVRAPVGKMNLSDQDYCIGRGLGAIMAKSDAATSLFLKYALDHNMNFLNRWSQGTTFLAISKSDLYKFPVPKFPFVKQEKIAAILNNIDCTIERTESLIHKYQQIKVGLMNDLFTRGVTAGGNLRQPREQAPELYKETHVGWIPREWDWKRCDEICDRICVGIVIRPADYYVTDGVPTFRSANVREEGVDESDFVFISQYSNQLLHKSQIHFGDILTVRTGYPGTSVVVPEEYDKCNCVDILISRPSGLIDPDFLCYWVNSSYGKGQVLRKQGGLAQQHFNVGEMKDLISVLPEKDEQLRIVERLRGVDLKIRTEKELLRKYQLQKFGLMQDLLTGKVQVKVDQ
ncbi:restriction endonuclease subunit S [Desulfogranum mediterraneum]|uniref:restriction endonuclease subunit S n=1 Tax=Desulfogranum mediterraneum TaxID=160661 RepID=UPI000424AD81|nr:restriction endonuclease subunit S [Desulfogranum mediterraneum]